MEFTRRRTTKAIGDEGEALALAHLQRAGLVLVERNYRVARGPHARGGEVDLILRERDGTLERLLGRVAVPAGRLQRAECGVGARIVRIDPDRLFDLADRAVHVLQTGERVADQVGDS